MTDAASSRIESILSRFAPREVDMRYRADGTILMQSPIPLIGCERHICTYLERWAAEAPDRSFLVQRDAREEWRHLSYAETWTRADFPQLQHQRRRTAASVGSCGDAETGDCLRPSR